MSLDNPRIPGRLLQVQGPGSRACTCVCTELQLSLRFGRGSILFLLLLLPLLHLQDSLQEVTQRQEVTAIHISWLRHSPTEPLSSRLGSAVAA